MFRKICMFILITACFAATCVDNEPGQDSFVDDLDLASFSPLVSISSMDFANIIPKVDTLYFELRTTWADGGDWESHEYNVINQFGTLCTAAEDEEQCLEEFESASTGVGFCTHGHPAEEEYYLVTHTSKGFETISTVDGVLAFVGDIDSAEDALMLLRAKCFFWGADDVAMGGIRQVDNGFEVIVTELVSLCVPLQTDRILLHVATDGTIIELDREVLSKEDNACA
ncbi:MAG: hypothetical protein GY847_07455 [Proteobacteria bacterium]|nr:hypothetical protein [Pseudomonadota bacterium]